MSLASRAFVGVAAMAALLQVVMATNYAVGGPSGQWDLSTNFQAWASPLTFHPGDSLIFIYSSAHDVVEVIESDYSSCIVTTPIQAFGDGNTVITLPAIGKRYFLCSVPGHCAAGMKVEIDVVPASAASPPPAPATPSPPPPVAPVVSPPAPKSVSPPPQVSVSPPPPKPEVPSPSMSPITLPPGMAPAPGPSSGISIAPTDMLMAPAPAPSGAADNGCSNVVKLKATAIGAGILLLLAL